MSYLTIENFALGLDRRRHILALPPGALYQLTNGHINRGGEIEKRKAFVAKYTLPAGTFGLQSAGGQLYVFGSGADPGAPVGVNYQRLQHPDGLSMTSFLKGTVFNRQIYALAKFNDGRVQNFYNGSIVHDWIDGVVRSAMVNNSGIATALAAAIDADPDYSASAVGAVVTVTGPGATTFDLTASAANGAAVNDQTAATALTQVAGAATALHQASVTFTVVGTATGADTMTSVRIDGVDIWGEPATSWTTMGATGTTAAAYIASKINSYSSSPEYTATSNGNDVTISAASGGSVNNGLTLVIYGLIDVSMGIGEPAPLAGGTDFFAGQPQKNTVTVGGTFEADDKFTVQIVSGIVTKTFGAGRAGGQQASSVITLRDKVYAGAGTALFGSGIANATGWNAEDIGSFVTDMSGQADQFDNIVGFGTFLNNLAIFARRATLIWGVDPDPTLNALVQSLPNIGSPAAKSIINYGDSDVFFMADNGVRSLRSQQINTTAAVSDIGTPIDPLIIAAIRGLGDVVAAQAAATIEPEDGRYWLALGSKIYVFSFFAASKISAWSVYDDGRTYTDFAVVGNRLYARAGDVIYLYGGDSGLVWDTSVLTIQLPFLSAKMLATVKHFTGFDITTEGEFTVSIGTDPKQPNVFEEMGVISGTTFGGQGDAPTVGESECFSLLLTHSKPEFAKLVHAVVHYEPVEAG